MRRLALLLSVPVLVAAGTERPLYKDPAQPVDLRVADLLSRMTLEEKVAQMLGIWKQKERITDELGAFLPDKAKEVIPHGIGEIARPTELRDKPTKILQGPRENAVFLNAVQKWLVEGTRLGIPALTHEEAVHGLTAPRGTSFPIPIALASSWDPDLLERVMSVAALEARARGTHHVLAPVLDLARDPRWGRTEETYGEDPYLVARLGVAAIRGYQGRS
jgi:beta-glucosidase